MSHAALRTSTAPQLLSKYYPYPPALCFFLRVRGSVTNCFFALCGFTDMPQTGLLTYSPQRLYHELLFLSHAALRTSTAPPLLSKYYPYPDCTLFFSSGQRLGYELLFCHMRLYGLQPLRNSFQSIILIRLHSVFFRVGGCVTNCFFPYAAIRTSTKPVFLTYTALKLLPVLILRKKIRLQMQPYFQIYARYQIKDLYKAMISSLVGSFGLPGRQASSMAD